MNNKSCWFLFYGCKAYLDKWYFKLGVYLINLISSYRRVSPVFRVYHVKFCINLSCSQYCHINFLYIFFSQLVPCYISLIPHGNVQGRTQIRITPLLSDSSFSLTSRRNIRWYTVKCKMLKTLSNKPQDNRVVEIWIRKMCFVFERTQNTCT